MAQRANPSLVTTNSRNADILYNDGMAAAPVRVKHNFNVKTFIIRHGTYKNMSYATGLISGLVAANESRKYFNSIWEEPDNILEHFLRGTCIFISGTAT